jgi:hypothetical protein
MRIEEAYSAERVARLRSEECDSAHGSGLEDEPFVEGRGTVDKHAAKRGKGRATARRKQKLPNTGTFSQIIRINPLDQIVRLLCKVAYTSFPCKFSCSHVVYTKHKSPNKETVVAIIVSTPIQ